MTKAKTTPQKKIQNEEAIISEMPITSIKDALDIACSFMHDHKAQKRDELEGVFNKGLRKILKPEVYINQNYKFPFGIWFRGHLNKEWRLEPSVFRKHNFNPNEKKIKVYDESSLIMHFKSKFPHYQQDHNSTFDWLCLMQHYDMPTRLLDWTESILVALYFAVNNHDGQRVNDEQDGDGALYALNAQRLNKNSRLHSRKGLICFPDSSDVILRSELGKSWSIDDLNRHLKKSGDLHHVLDALYDTNCVKKVCKGEVMLNCHFMDTYKENLATPIAVFPNRINGRMVTQSSTMIIFGGRKLYDNTAIHKKNNNGGFAEPMDLYRYHTTVFDGKKNSDTQFLVKFIIPKECKPLIRKELHSIGINESAIYPETDYQARYIRRQWRLTSHEPL